MSRISQIEPILGFIGASFLVLRFFPLLYEQIYAKKKINLFFLILEGIASIFLGTSAIILNAYPMILANSISLLNIIIIIFVQLKLRLKPQTTTPTIPTAPIPRTPPTITLTPITLALPTAPQSTFPTAPQPTFPTAPQPTLDINLPS